MQNLKQRTSFMAGRLVVTIVILLMLLVGWQAQGQDSMQGAFYTGEYPNLLKEWGLSDAEIQARIDQVWEQLFYGDDETERVYYPVGDDMAYIADIANDDVRSEGMSYGMMIAVQLDKKEEFDRLWTWAKTYMYHPDGQRAGYFAWHNNTDGKILDHNSAPDGETWFVTALFFAAGRWGNGEGIYNYEAEANAILQAMLSKNEEGSRITNMFDAEHKMVVFVPQSGLISRFTDPSYHTPHYYELWARWAAQDNEFWQEAAQVSREFWHLTAHPETGLMPNYAAFTGEPQPSGDYGEYFYADAWRCIMNVAVDYSWFAADPWQVENVDRQLAFFYDLGIGVYNSRFTIAGEPVAPQHRTTALIAMNAVGSLAASTDTKWEFVEEFWNTPIPSGQWRYYDGLLYTFALLQLSGNFRIYAPESAA
jgi:oligosaccharide reducing-end xylanase